MRLSRSLLVIAGVAALAACSDDAVTTVRTEPQAFVRLVHASPNTAGVDAVFQDRVENLPTWYNVAFRGFTGYYQAVNAGNRTIRVFTTVTGISPTAPTILVDNQQMQLDANQYYTLIYTGSTGGTGATAPRLLVLQDALPATPPTGVAIRVVHAAQGTGAVDTYVLAGGSTGLTGPVASATNLAFGAQSQYLNVPVRATGTAAVNLYRFAVTPAGSTTIVADATPNLRGEPAVPPPSSNPTARPLDALAGVQIAGSVLTAIVVPAGAGPNASVTTPSVLLLPDRNPPRISQ